MVKKPKVAPSLKLDLSFGPLPEGHPFTRLFDPLGVPWKLKSGSVSEAYSAYLLGRVPGQDRARWMQELWRVLAPGAKCTIVVPYWTSARAVQDPLSAWPPLCEQSFLYFNKAWRAQNRLDDIGCDFDFSYGYTLDPETTLKSDDVRPHWIKHFSNAVMDLQVILTRKP